MSVSGTPDRPKPPHKIVAPEGISSTAVSAEEHTLFISSREAVEENNLARRSVWGKLAKFVGRLSCYFALR